MSWTKDDETRLEKAMLVLPEHMREGVRIWVTRGLPHPRDMGIFFRAVLLNDLRAAVLGADDKNRAALNAWVLFVYNDIHSDAHGTMEKLFAWSERGGAIGDGT